MAAEDFKVRYNLVGALGGEMFAPLPEKGLVGAVVHTHVDGKKLTGNDGVAATRIERACKSFRDPRRRQCVAFELTRARFARAER